MESVARVRVATRRLEETKKEWVDKLRAYREDIRSLRYDTLKAKSVELLSLELLEVEKLGIRDGPIYVGTLVDSLESYWKEFGE